jgi:hypothetical protein
MARRKSLAVPFVATIAAACARTGPAPQPESHNPPEVIYNPPPPDPSGSIAPQPSTSAPPLSSASTAPAASVVYNGYNCTEGKTGPVADCPPSLLPAPPTDKLVYKKYDGCHRVPDGHLVRCPEKGPTAILPATLSVESSKGSKIELDEGALDCREFFSMTCPEGAKCNPPPPKTVPCPPELRPTLAAGVKPTKRQGNRCWFDLVEVVCPQ